MRDFGALSPGGWRSCREFLRFGIRTWNQRAPSESGLRVSFFFVLIIFHNSGKKPININIFGGTASGTNRNRPWDKWDPSPGTKWDPSLGQTGLSLFNSTVKSPFCPVCPWDRWGFVPGTIVPQGPSEKCLCVFLFIGFFAPK